MIGRATPGTLTLKVTRYTLNVSTRPPGSRKGAYGGRAVSDDFGWMSNRLDAATSPRNRQRGSLGEHVGRKMRFSEVPGIPIRQGRQTDSSRPGESACLASSRGARSENRRFQKFRIQNSELKIRRWRAAETAAPQWRSGRAGERSTLNVTEPRLAGSLRPPE